METIHFKAIRELKNISQKYIAKELGISQSYYSKLENYRLPFPRHLVKRIKEILQIDQLHPEILSKEDLLSSLNQTTVSLETLNIRITYLEKKIYDLEIIITK